MTAAVILPPIDSWEHVLGAVGLGAARTVPLTWLVPAFGGPRVSAPLRVGVGALFSVLCLPILLPAVAAAPLAALGPVGWVLLAGRELLVGLTVGLCAGAVFQAAAAAGHLADTARGANLAEALSPASGQRLSATGELYLFVAIMLFLELGGLRVFAAALARGYEAVPVATPLPRAAAAGLRPAVEIVTLAVAKLLESAVGLAAPVLVAAWLGDVTLGIIGRAAPQLPLFFVGLPAKALLGLGVVLVGLGAVDAAFVAGFPAWMAVIERAFAAWL